MRKVKVGLEADVAGFVGQVKVATKSVDDLGDKVDRLDGQLNKIPPDAAKAGAAMKLLDGDVKSVGKTVNDLGDKQGTGLTVLDSKIRATRAEVRKLADEFIKTGSTDTFKKLGEAEGLLQMLTKTRKGLASAIEGGVSDAASSPAAKAGGTQIGLAIGGALAVPLLAAVGGAVAAAAGAGIAGAGIAGAIMGDPEKFKFAWGQAASEVSDDFLSATKVFTGPTMAAIQGIGPLVASWHIDKIFKDAAQYAEPLVHGVEGFATGIVRGVGALVEKGGPAVTALTSGLTELGQAGANALGDIADGAEGGAYALHDTIHAVSTLIEIFGKVTQAAENTYQFIHDHPIESAVLTSGLTLGISALEKTDGLTKQLGTTELGLQQAALKAGHAFSAQGDDLTALSQKLGTATVSVDTLAASMVNKLFTATMNLDQANLAVNSSLLTVAETFEKNGKAIDKHTGLVANNTEKGIANREAVLAAVTSNMQAYQSQIAVGMSAEEAAKNYDLNTASLEGNLRKAKLTTEQIDDLIGKYRGIPANVDRDIAINGLTAAINGLSDLIKLINGIHDKTVTVYYRTRGQSLNAPLAHGGIRRAAVGMIIPPSDPGTTLVGEPQTGGEALIPFQGISQGRAMDLMQQVGAGYGLTASRIGYADMRSTGQMSFGGGSGMPSHITLEATFIDPMDGTQIRKQAITWSINRGRDPADFFTKA